MKFLTCISLVFFLIIGCKNNKKGADLSEVNLEFKANLKKFNSCGELEQGIKKELIKAFKRNYYRDLKYLEKYGLNYYGTYANDASAMSFPESAGTTTGVSSPANANTTQDSSSGTGQDYSKTNTQEAGVDEGDIVKTDGNFIYILKNNHFLIIDPANPAALLMKTDIDLNSLINGQTEYEYANELYLHQNKVVIVSNYSSYSMQSKTTVAMDARYPYYATNSTKIRIYDVTDRSSPILQSEYIVPGYMQGTRLLGSGLFVVNYKEVYLQNIKYVWQYLNNSINSDAEYQDALTKALQANIDIINSLTISEIWPQISKRKYNNDGGTSDTVIEMNCNKFYIPEGGNGHHFSIVARVDLDSPDYDITSGGVVSSWGTLYMSQKSLYLASMNQWLWIMPTEIMNDLKNPEPSTAVYKFDISETGSDINYKGSGLVTGWVNNQFSMGEFNGFLRMGTTRGGFWGENISNQMITLYENNGELAEAAKIENLALGERIYSMRYDGNRGYMVTFRQTDPLFTFDLTDPFNPILKGELKVSGFATYIHPFGENNNRLMTIGRAADETGRVTGNKLQIFDVSNLANPALLFEYELGMGWSDAIYDHHAFLYYAPKQILAIPYYSYDYFTYKSSSGLRVFNATETSLSLLKEISHSDSSQLNYWSSNVDRAVIIGNYIYSISGQKIKANNLNDLSQESSLSLPQGNAYLIY